MELALLPDRAATRAPRPNGGFPEPAVGEPARLVAAHDPECGAETLVRVPAMLPAGVVRRLRCAHCERFFSPDRVEDLGVEPAQTRPQSAASPAVELQRAEAVLLQPSAPERMVAERQAPAAPGPVPAAVEPQLSLLDRLLILLPEISLPRPSLPAIALPNARVPGLRLPEIRLPDLALPPFDPDGRAWRLASIPLAAIAVVVGLLLIQGGGGEPQTAEERSVAAGPASPGEAQGSSGGGNAKVSGDAKLVRGSSYSLALPGGWDQVQPQGGATFAAVAADGGADATLWIERDPSLDFPTFVARSIEQLRGLAGSARVVERVPAPTIEATVVRLAADAPAGQPTYEVTLRAVGPYRYYLATSVQPDASAEAVEGAALVAGSFTPDLGGRG